ncbi:hypothetical protein SCHPADRAFT_892293 [Schizopora paradoxa]|uniref:Uncharacterized protein n=1 Tax=Schizopora paradoxa TaxID=27342 RepID=A0A0H2RM25_9AGAM|nr:hypothetical protein SCHPADRAFT_892293 [Schizopora paradoxa]
MSRYNAQACNRILELVWDRFQTELPVNWTEDQPQAWEVNRSWTEQDRTEPYETLILGRYGRKASRRRLTWARVQTRRTRPSLESAMRSFFHRRQSQSTGRRRFMLVVACTMAVRPDDDDVFICLSWFILKLEGHHKSSFTSDF